MNILKSLVKVTNAAKKMILLVLFLTILTIVLMSKTARISHFVHAQTELIEAQVQLANTSASGRKINIHRYSAPPYDPVNSYWIETDQGVIIVEAQRFLSQARYLANEIRAVTNKPLLGIFITHHHTDHLGGLPALVEAFGNVPIYASQFVRDDIETDEYGFLARRKKLHGNDFPAREDIPRPDRIIADKDKIELGGLTFEVVEFQDNESPVSTIYYLPEQNALFSGDFVTKERIPFLRNQHTENWIAQLQTLLDRYPNQIIYSGHGEPDSTQQLIKTQIEYIESVRNLVAEALTTNSEISSEEKAGIVAEMKQKYPNHQTTLIGRDGIDGFIEGNIDAVAEELKSKS
ncbi:MBL fold metallo-hydrolase [Pleurocapsales cyanobacterium LEGE 10410]|nr:MBL fold metallo-hydrolase [Pleurocapsales cyanobacterium LEGE 10410]